MRYRRTRIKGGTYSFTGVTYKRIKLLEGENISVLYEAFEYAMRNHPFEMDAYGILPDHLHCIWTLPDGDEDYSTRWRLAKRYFSRKCVIESAMTPSASRVKKKEKAVWQRRFWEHLIRDEDDFAKHVEYIHYNPVKHGLVMAPRDWEYSSFGGYVEEGIYDREWGAAQDIRFDQGVGSE